MKLKNNSGFGLLILTTLIGATALILSASSWFLVQQVRQTQLRIDQTKAHYLAQAAAIRAIWNWYTFSTTLESREWATVNTTITGNQIIKAGLDAGAGHLESDYVYIAPIRHTGIAHVQSQGTAQNKVAGTTLVRTLAAASTLGDFYVVYFAMDDVGGAVSCADSDNNVYNIALDVTNAGDVRTVIFYAVVDTAQAIGDTITVTHPNATARAMTVRQFRGVDNLDQTNSATGTSLVANAGNITTIYPNELMVTAIGAEGPGGDTFTVGAGWTTATDIGTTGGLADTNITIDPEYRLATARGTYTGNGTVCTAAQSAAGRDWSAITAGFIGRAHWYTPPATANRRLRGWTVQNVHTTAANTIIVTRVKVSWTGGGLAQLTDIRLNNLSIWTGTAASGTEIDVTASAVGNRTLAGDRAVWSGINTYLQWNNSGPADPATVTVQFTFSDNSATAYSKTNEVRLWEGCQTAANCDGLGTPLGIPGERTFTVTGTGQVNQTTNKYFKVMKTVRSTVSGAPGISTLEITDWDEGDKNIP